MRTLGKALSVVAAAAALSATAMAAPASAAVTIKVEQISSQTVREWWGVQVTCPPNQVLTGRSHYGDENAYTTYYCSRILINGEQVEVHTGDWTSPQRESRSDYSAPNDQVIVGRWHEGDENGYTRYRSAALYWQGRQVRLIDGDVSGQYTESSHTWQAKAGRVMTGRTHYGDENGKTTYRSATVYFEG
ncbi:hypothetical protein [Microbispora triticiradicis]|uniref:hypothetical protein n=1 Tax=Microbispora triticiradicis TaxID=2200763 RepID=UPI001AD70AD3|nr:hypothetical protein [Microbispora triticiradicis]MBO4269474.1 hypothetical protein [Microbispora triticiradicis]